MQESVPSIDLFTGDSQLGKAECLKSGFTWYQKFKLFFRIIM